MKETGQDNFAIRAKANKYMKIGYEKLKAFETKNGGFDWFPRGSGNESLTAYALLQFAHMKEVYNGVEQSLIDRSADFILSKRNGHGGFNISEKTTYSLGGIKDIQLNAFIVYALSEAKVKGIEKELNTAYKKALKSKDDYQKSLVANALFNYGQSQKANELLASLTGQQLVNSRTTFGGRKMAHGVQTDALKLMAFLQQEKIDMPSTKKLASSIRNKKQGNGTFGSTFSTAMALRALTRYTNFSKQTAEDGIVEVYVNNEKVATQAYKKGEYEPIKITGLGQYFKPGKSNISIKYPGVKYPLPHTVSVNWQSAQPENSKNCALALNTRMEESSVKVGETVRVSATLSNTTDKVQATPMAIIGLPAGLTPQSDQLKQMMDREEIAYYEIVGNNLIFYYRQIQPDEQKKIKLDLKADFAGHFEAPASSTYSYYAGESRHWSSLGEITVTN